VYAARDLDDREMSPSPWVYKSPDAGKTWTFIGTRDVGHISTIRVHPTKPDLVDVAALGNQFVPNS